MAEDNDDTTTVTTLTDDMGGGGLLCDKCKYFQGWAYSWTVCPKCKRKVVEIGSASPYPFGGSDF